MRLVAERLAQADAQAHLDRTIDLLGDAVLLAEAADVRPEAVDAVSRALVAAQVARAEVADGYAGVSEDDDEDD